MQDLTPLPPLFVTPLLCAIFETTRNQACPLFAFGKPGACLASALARAPSERELTDVADVGHRFEMRVLRPQGRRVLLCDIEDDAVCHGQLQVER